ncbi:neither inactivation nor afterpotential protein C isoform X1 [Bombus impatiens]|uniref:non-specific serine/threonine protein kinase n=1 Tax=Bombus impatiens TaxID=132113 RepID=A0A6P3V0H0_BOMIM|nr:neither inactivation nor afterpotential protein C isoform X1 [Bombus impatiens]XP_024225634.1 neither inactivation nor afterpotential protein C isoform X1 [Bombus impatiens]
MSEYGYDRRGGREQHRRGGGRGEHEDDVDDRGRSTLQRFDSIQDPGKRYLLRECIGSGVCGDVYEAIDQQAGNKRVAVKVQKLTPESQSLIIEEYKILRDFASHPNLPDFYGIYRRRSGKKTEYDQIWFVMELCEGGTVMDLVHGLLAMDKKMREEHIGFILKEVIQAMVYLNEHNVMHRDIRGSNILLTKEGEVKLVDFGLSKMFEGEMGKRYTCIGSPSWMAPEVAMSKGNSSEGYGSRADVWAIGITAIELADGKPPFQDMHPTRALFQIVRNPPPNLYRPSNWSQNFNDFIAECLEKNPENRPFMAEIAEHPFLADSSADDFLLAKEIKILMTDVCAKGKHVRRPEVIVRKGFLKTHQTDPLEPMFMEDLAALETLTEDTILDELHERLRQGYYHSFIGDILLILNPNEQQDIYGSDYHTKYQFKSRSDNAPHIYSVADSAYQDVLHNEEAQHILLAGESNSGKTTNLMHLVRHLMYLGKSLQDIGARLMRAIKVIHAFSNAATPLNPNSTRCVLELETTYGSSGKASGAIFWLYQLEKWRVSTRDRNQSNFHVLYYFYDGLDAISKLKQYHLPPGRRMRYLRISEKGTERKRSFKVRNDPRGNVAKFEELKENLTILEMEEYCETIWKILAAILNLGEIRFVEGNNGEADMDNHDAANRVAQLLDLDEKKFNWALLNYCVIVKGNAVRRRHSCEEAKEARDVLANTIYQRLVDWITNTINFKFTVTRALFGDKYAINIMDMFGFECFATNRLEQLVVNTMNEQMQCYYNQRIFAWEMQEQEEEDIPMQRLHFYDNKDAIDQLMSRDRGLFSIIDNASKNMLDYQYIINKIQQRSSNVYIKAVSSHEFTVAHYTGKLLYDASEIAEKNRDFLPPEIIETFRQSSIETVKEMFTNKLTKAGNLTVVVDHPKIAEKKTSKGKWGALMQETSKPRRYNTASRGQYSQTRKLRTCAATFKSTSLEILKNLSAGGGSSGIHFIRCIRSDLEGAPRGFYRDVVRQQIRALAVLDTARARQRGYPHRISFPEFLRRYQFLAFDFDENVEITKDNCRLLLIRLKMEGWIIGKTKVFLKYYNEEYLSRLYETQVKKIVKVQCMMRAFLARKNMASKITKSVKKEVVKKASINKNESVDMSEDQAALMIQKAYRGHVVRKETAPLLGKGKMDPETMDMMKFYSSKWRSKSVFQVLLRYRAARYQDLVQFSQQVHLFNQAIVASLTTTNEQISIDRVDTNVSTSAYLGQLKPPQVHKLPFNFHQELPFPDTKSGMRGVGSASSSASDDEHEAWDAPLRRQTVPWANRKSRTRDVEVQTTNSPQRVAHSGTEGQSLIDTPFSRDPNISVRCPPEESSQNRMGNSGFQHHSSNRSPVPSANAHNPRSNYDSTGSIRSRKHAPPPPVPFNQSQPPLTRNVDNYSSDIRSKSNVDTGSHDWEYEDKTNRSSGNANRINPIQELQMIGRKSNTDGNEDSDEPPFNFQAMLRKTSHHRASMKRTPVYDSYSHSPSPLPGSGYRGNRENESHVVYRSGGSRRDSPEWSPNEMVRMSEKYAKEGAWGEDRTGTGGRSNVVSESVTEEIAPGIVIEGYVAEL